MSPGAPKARLLIQAFGERGFDYAENSRADLAIWPHARKAYVVGRSSPLKQKIGPLNIPVDDIETAKPSLVVWLRALRIHQ